MDNTQINIMEIMQEIRNDIKEKGYVNDLTDFDDIVIHNDCCDEYDAEYYKELINRISSSSNVAWYRELYCGGIKKFIKKCIRKAITFIIRPIAEEQSAYNVEVSKAFKQVEAYMIQQENIIKMYQKKVDELEKQVIKLQKN